jgi:DNA-binding transcriptional ArsR family regulator
VKADDRLSVIFGALADPTRREILSRLADGDATVTELAEPFAISMPAISRHLKVLERAGLISREPFRPVAAAARWKRPR